jgi:endonuclease I
MALSMSLKKLSSPVLLALCCLPLMAQADVFINEIHYDDIDADNNESIEVVATGSEDLTQYRIVLYNGSNGTPYPDATGTALPAGIARSCGTPANFATLVYPENGVQNGAPDGIALIGPGDAVIQFLSYEGSFVANGGPANGMQSTDIGVAEGNTTPEGHSLQLTGSGNAYADFSWQAPATSTFDNCNNGQTFTGGVDQPPTLAGSIPVNNAPAFPSNADLQISFSESVDLGATWFQIVCSLSGTRDVADTVVSGTNAVYGINPLLDFDPSETCTLTLDANQITDRGGTAQTLSGPNTVAFTVGPPTVNDPPVVLATTPMNGDTTFPPAGNLSVMFSETVNLLANAFTLSCAQSGSVALSSAASGMSFSIDTATALIGGESCTFTIVAKRVSDLEGAPLAADVVVTFTVRLGGVGDYYSRVNESSPEQLRCSLNTVIEGHTTYPYTSSETDTWDILNMADEDPVDSSKILDIYKNESYTKITGGTGIYNREHTWPNTYGFSGGNPGPYTDTHMLHLTNTQYNSDRGSKPFANCDAGCTELATTANHGFGGGGGGDSNYVLSAGSENNGSFEVWDHLKGNMARAMMYMAIRYEGEAGEPDLELTDTRSQITSAGVGGKHYMGLLSTLLQWHLDDPVDARELDRNEVIFNFQGNRNPFVDHPEWGTLALFQSTNPAVCELAGQDAIFADGFEAAVAP